MRAPALLSFAFAASVAASLACSNQGEGEFCNPNNGNNDCQGGLTCVPAPGLSDTLTNRDRCCPVLPAQPTTSACALNTTAVIDAATEVPDGTVVSPGPDAEAGSPSEASVPDATGDVVLDSPADVVAVPDASHEAGADASPE